MVGISDTANGEPFPRIGAAPADPWILVHVPGPSVAPIGRRTPPAADAADTGEAVEVAIVAPSAREGSKSEVIGAIACRPARSRFQGCSLSAIKPLGRDVVFQPCPFPICWDMPTGRTQSGGICCRVPIVKPSVGGHVEGNIVVITAGAGARGRPFSVVGQFWNGGAIRVEGCPKVLRKPALVTDGRQAIVVSIHAGHVRIRAAEQSGAASVVGVGGSVVLGVVGVRTALDHKRGAASVVGVGRSVVLGVVGVRTALDHERGAASVVHVGTGVVLGVV